MPSTERVEKSQLAGTIDSFLEKRSREGCDDPSDPDFLTIIEFIERFKLLPYGLFPAQKFILKLYYNIPLNDVDKTIIIRDPFTNEVTNEFTEIEYLKFLHSEGRCNIKKQDGRIRYELILVLGRRGSKSTLCAIIAAYELYKLLRRGHPQAYYGIPSGNPIKIFCIANDKDQASIVYDEMSGYISQIDYFKSAQNHDTQTFMKFQTDHDKKRYGEGAGKKATLSATFKSSIAKGLRGRGTICVILDELAFFVDDGKSSAQKVYKALVPSISQFSPKDPKNRLVPLGPPEGRVMSISSPDAKEGHFYHLYQTALANSKASANMLMIQAPTWEINPTLHSDHYEVEYVKNPESFWTEYGARFSDRVRGWIEDKNDLLDCIKEDARPLVAGVPREMFWAGVDFGISRDGTAIVLTRINDGKVELAYHESWYAGVRWKESNPHLETPLIPYAYQLQDVNRLDIDEIAHWFDVLSNRFYIVGGVFDQWAGPVFAQKLHKIGLTQFEMRNFTHAEASKAFQTTKMMMFAKQLALYDWPLPKIEVETKDRLHSPLIEEMLELQAKSGGKNIMIVEAPKVAGKHDDISDAFVRSVLLVSEYISDHPDTLEISGTRLALQKRRHIRQGYRQFHRNRMRLHGPPPRERTVPIMFKRR
jgi:hypothetical protein